MGRITLALAAQWCGGQIDEKYADVSFLGASGDHRWVKPGELFVTLGKSLPYMARYGYWIVISTLAGTETNIALRPLLTKGLHLVGSTLRSRTPQFKAQLLATLTEKVWPKVASGEVRPTIYKVLPITEAEAAHDILYRGENVGKVVLTVD